MMMMMEESELTLPRFIVQYKASAVFRLIPPVVVVVGVGGGDSHPDFHSSRRLLIADFQMSNDLMSFRFLCKFLVDSFNCRWSDNFLLILKLKIAFHWL